MGGELLYYSENYGILIYYEKTMVLCEKKLWYNGKNYGIKVYYS